MSGHIRIFVAYAWDDRAPEVRAMAKILQTIERFKIWIDIEHLVGKEMSSIEEGLNQNDVVLLFASDMYKTDKRSQTEITQARQKGKLIIPIRMKKDLPMDGPLSFIPNGDCQIDFTHDKPFSKISEDIILLIKKTLS